MPTPARHAWSSSFPWLVLPLLLAAATTLPADEPVLAGPAEPELAPASDEGEKALAGFQIPQGMRGSLFAAEPMLANPVAFFVDHRGRVFVCETFRQGHGVTDNRDHDDRWLVDDLAAQTVEDRLAYHKKHLGEKIAEYTRHDDRVRLLEDRDHDGRADRSTVFADHFHQVVDGTGAGVLARGDDVFFACIPHLWRLRDSDGDGRAEQRESLYSGFGVRVAFRGHDLHGLVIGPDGKLYFSCGDRGYNVQAGERQLVNPESGAVFRCELDGSNLEVVHTGLRNPQELAFDDYGNLFTCDNNSDSGDRARLVYVAEGGDSGWRMAFQYLPDRGPWNREKLWHPFDAKQPTWSIPPIANIADGPSGLAFYPGTGLSVHFQGRFLLCDFRGSPSGSGIRSFRVKPSGAFFQLADEEKTFGNILATDLDFGPDGALYVCDWVNGWNGEGKGRIYRFTDPAQAEQPLVRETYELLSKGVTELPAQRLAELLAHPDRRVRLEAQFALAAMSDRATLTSVTRTARTIPRLHAIWGLTQCARRADEKERTRIAGTLTGLLDASDPEVRAQAARAVGDLRIQASAAKLVGLLRDEQRRVRYFAAMSLGKVGNVSCVEPLLNLLADNADRDPIVRHGGILGLAGAAEVAQLRAQVAHESPAVRAASVVALRRRGDTGVVDFLADREPRVVVEAARAIHDLPILDAMPALARVAAVPGDDALTRRVLNANYRLGEASNAETLATFAANPDAPAEVRIEAMEMLALWAEPPGRDRVLGMWRPLPARASDAAVTAVRTRLAGILAGPEASRRRAVMLASALKIREIAPTLHEILADEKQSPESRSEALSGLEALDDPGLLAATQRAITDSQPLVRDQARRLLARQDPASAVPILLDVLANGDNVERQGALETLAPIADPRVDQALADRLDQLADGQLAPEIQLDLLRAAARRDSPLVKSRLEKFEESRRPDDPLADLRETLFGGNADRGRRLFFERTQVSCQRCHKIGDRGGDVGPNLTEKAKQWSQLEAPKRRQQLLESLVLPSKVISEGYQTVTVVTGEGKIVTGIKRSDDDQQLVLTTAEGTTITLAKSDIDDVTANPKSAMPDDVTKHLSKSELRDLVEFLAELK